MKGKPTAAIERGSKTVRSMGDSSLLQLRFDAFELDEKDARLSQDDGQSRFHPRLSRCCARSHGNPDSW
jgi:hypothetical protein